MRFKKSCYNCQYFSLCRLRDRASNLADYTNTTGNLLTAKFPERLYKLIGLLCLEYKKEQP